MSRSDAEIINGSPKQTSALGSSSPAYLPIENVAFPETVPGHQRSLAVRDRIRLGIEACTLVVIIAGGLLAYRQLKVLRSSIDMARESIAESRRQNELTAKQFEENVRPWISVDVALRRFTLANGEAQLVTDVVLKNVGNAVGVGIHVLTQVSFQKQGKDWREAQRAACKALRDANTARERGYALFPGETAVESITSPLSRGQLQDASIIKNDTMILPVFGGCVDYQYPSSQAHHQTQFAYEVIRVKPEQPGAVFSIDLKAWPEPSAIRLLPDFISSRYAD